MVSETVRAVPPTTPVTVPIAPLSKVTTLFAATVPKPKPLMVRDVVSMDTLAVLLVMTGVTFATFTAAPLPIEVLVTTAVKLPDVVGLVVMLTVKEVLLAAVTTPAAPLLNTTELLAAVGSNPKPLMVIVDAFAANDVEAVVTTGLTLAT